MENSENIVIYEESIIPEDKVIHNDKIQEDDLLNELIKLDPNNSKGIKKRIKNFMFLKQNNSIFDDDKNITGFELKGESYKPLQDHLKNFNRHALYKPIVSEKKRYFEVSDITKIKFPGFNGRINPLTSDDKIMMETFENHINKENEIHNEYKKGVGRVNYSYTNETNAQYELMDAYTSINKGFSTDLKKDIEVYSNCFKESCKQFLGDETNINRHILLGNTIFNDKLIVKGNKISNIGFVKLPETKLNEELYKNNKSLIENSNAPVYINMKHLENNIQSEIITSEYNLGDTVNICIENKQTIQGKITDINDVDYIIDINTEPVETLRINKKDSNVRITKLIPSCLDLDTDSLSVYLYDKQELNKADLDNYLTKILPDLGSIINNIDGKEKFTSLEQFKDKLFRYGYTPENIPSNHFKTIKTILSTNNKSQKTLTTSKEKKGNEILDKKNYPLVNNHSLDQVNYYYGEYPDYKTSRDTETNRLEWLKKSFDHGHLFFKTITHNVNKSFLKENAKRLESMIKVQERVTQSKEKLVENLDKELSKIEKDNKCGGMRLVKTYTDMDQLKLDNNRDVLIEEDKLIEGETTNRVQPGQYAILIEDYDRKKIYKRHKVQSTDVWVIEKDLNVDMIISSYKDFCVQQGMSIEEIDTTFLRGKNRCKYSEHYKRCLPIRIIKLKDEIDSYNKQLVDISKNIEDINNKDKVLQKQEEELLLLKNKLESDNNRKINIEFTRKEYKKNDRSEEDIYQYHYYRIDKYLENIKSLPLNKFYTSLSLLLDKYGRNGSVIDGENDKFFYSRPGNKQIICKHHSHFIDYNNKLITYDEALEKTITEYGVENEGFIWCKNCGEQINGADFETQEGFLESGARDITHEVIDASEEVYKSEENSEIVEFLRKSLLEGDDKSIENQGLSVIRIITVLTNIMGIKLSNSDELSVLTLSNSIEASKIKNKDAWISAAKQKQKKASNSFLESAYNNYRIRTIILYTASILFLFVQSSETDYAITKTFSRCKPSLRGHPLDKVYKQEGIDYISCVLDSLSSLGVDWSSIKKIKTKDNIIKKIDEFYNDNTIRYRYERKRKLLKEQNKEIKEYSYEWNEFRPPLKKFDLDIKELKTFNTIQKHIKSGDTEKVNSELQKMKAFESNVCLKLIEEIDEQIMENDIVNKPFTPNPLDNLCCLQEINKTYNYLADFISKNKNIQELIEIIYKYNQTKQDINKLLKESKIFILSELQPTLISFNRNIGKDRDELTEEDIQNLYVKFIDNGFFEGEKHIYEQNYCILTGENKLDIMTKKYKKDDYYDLVDKVNKKKLFNIEDTVYKEIEDKISHVIDSNIRLQGNEFLTNFNSKLKANKNKKLVWGEMKEQINTLCDLLSTQFSEKLNITNREQIKQMLLSLGEKECVLENDLENMDEEEAYTKFYIDKINLLQSFTLTYLKNTILKIKNKKNIVEAYIPEEWNLNPKNKNGAKLIEEYSKIVMNNNKDTESFLHLGTTHSAMLEKMVNIISGSSKNIKILSGSTNINVCEEQQNGELYSNISMFLHYIFLFIISELIEADHKITVNNDDDDFNNIQQTDEIEANLIYKILSNIEEDAKLLDKHTSRHIKSVIEQKTDSQKEETLKFVQELDKETWASLKMRISVGLDNWKDISSKEKTLYFHDKKIGENENIQLDTITESNEDESEETEGENRDQANLQSENNERVVMPDDDGEDGGEMEY